MLAAFWVVLTIFQRVTNSRTDGQTDMHADGTYQPCVLHSKQCFKIMIVSTFIWNLSRQCQLYLRSQNCLNKTKHVRCMASELSYWQITARYKFIDWLIDWLAGGDDTERRASKQHLIDEPDVPAPPNISKYFTEYWIVNVFEAEGPTLSLRVQTTDIASLYWTTPCSLSMNLRHHKNCKVFPFYRAMHVVLARYCYRNVVHPSVCPSVRPSVTLMYAAAYRLD